jgi:hypothetical protein
MKMSLGAFGMILITFRAILRAFGRKAVIYESAKRVKKPTPWVTAGAVSGSDAGWIRTGEGVGVSAAGAAAIAGPGGGAGTGKCDTGTPDCWPSFPDFSQAAFAALSSMGQTSSAQRGSPSSRTSAPIRETEERVRK